LNYLNLVLELDHSIILFQTKIIISKSYFLISLLLLGAEIILFETIQFHLDGLLSSSSSISIRRRCSLSLLKECIVSKSIIIQKSNGFININIIY
jgi:hypothetical protein